MSIYIDYSSIYIYEIDSNNKSIYSIDIINELTSESDLEGKIILLNKTNKLGTKLYTIKWKIRIIRYAKDTHLNRASIKFNVLHTTIRDWMKNEKNYLNLDKSKLTKNH